MLFEARQTLFGYDKGAKIEGDYPHLQAGQSVFPFSFLFPNEPMPASIEGGIGHVRYFLYAYIDQPWQIDTTSNHVILTHVPIELVDTPALVKPVEVLVTKNTGTCVPAGSIVLKTNLPKTGYLAGEIVQLAGEIVNLSSKVDVERVEVILKQQIKFRAHRSTQSIEYILETFDVLGLEVKASCGSRPFFLNLQIPTTISPAVNSQLITNAYAVKVVVHVSGWWRRALKVKMPIHIGTAATSLSNILKSQTNAALQAFPSENTGGGYIEPSAPAY